MSRALTRRAGLGYSEPLPQRAEVLQERGPGGKELMTPGEVGISGASGWLVLWWLQATCRRVIWNELKFSYLD